MSTEQQRTRGEEDEESFSSDSDDEFLTLREDGQSGSVDREALVRKKLLESFYGKTVEDQEESEEGDTDDSEHSSGRLGQKNRTARRRSQSHDTYDDSDDGEERSRQRKSKMDPAAIADLDSPHFDAVKHTEHFVLESGVHPLLDTEESLACQVRTLDSSMQTLVYENYSRFIEATDAIRAIGVNVQANASNLQKLSNSMVMVGDTARNVESTCGALRDAVVEKLRVKRLLQRLDALLKLPSTLRDNIAAGRYRWASKSYLTAYSILNKHSEGFESLQRIETECYEIMQNLLIDVRRKLLHWSGNAMIDDDVQEDKGSSSDDEKAGGDMINEYQAAQSRCLEDAPDPPKTVSEIFECAGTPVLILNYERKPEASQASQYEDNKIKDAVIERPATITRMSSQVEFEPGLSIDQCKEMALTACLRLLDRNLDSHHIEVQESFFVPEGANGSIAMNESDPLLDASGLTIPNMTSGLESPGSTRHASGKLIPTNVLDSILETATLFSMTFPVDHEENSQQLSQFVSTAFYSFLQHIRSELLEHAIQMNPKEWKHEKQGKLLQSNLEVLNEDLETGEEIGEGNQELEENPYEHITSATTLLLESVRQLASGLALPEVAVDLNLASSLVDQAVELSEAMVRKRVEQKFCALRIRVIEDCLAPFCRNALQKRAIELENVERAQKDGNRLDQVVQMASVALSDSLQLVDDTVRSILTNAENAPASSCGEDASMLKRAVEHSTTRFAMWLAAAMETLAGCESDEPNHIVDVRQVVGADNENIGENLRRSSTTYQLTFDDENYELKEAIGDCMSDLLDELDTFAGEPVKSELTLAIAEVCRVAQRSVTDDLLASIATHTGIINKQARSKAGLFATNPSETVGDASSPTSERFRLAASRVINLFAIDRGNDAGNLLCSSLLLQSSKDEKEEISGPCTGSCSLLAVLKNTICDYADLFGVPRRTGPIPDSLEDEYSTLTISRQQQAFRASGLAFDVERMFSEKIVAYPHPSEFVDLQRTSLAALVFKVALKVFVENTRLTRFSVHGYRQLQVDMEFLKFMLPHYVIDENLADGSHSPSVLLSLLSEIVKCAKERCDGSALLQDDTTEINNARALVREFYASNQGEDGLLYEIIAVGD